MKKYFKNGIALLLPFSLVVWILMWVYDKGQLVIDLIVPESWGTAWWYPIAGVVAVVLAILIIGVVFSWIKPLKWLFKKVEDWVITRIPVVNKIYGFGKEVADSFITDIKEDGYLSVIEVEKDDGLYLGVLMDAENNTVFIPYAPNPMSGPLFRTKKYRILETMEYMEALQFVTSLGKINGEKWK